MTARTEEAAQFAQALREMTAEERTAVLHFVQVLEDIQTQYGNEVANAWRRSFIRTLDR